MKLKEGLTLNQHHKILVGFMGMCLEDCQAQLAHEGVEIGLDELDALARDIVQESKERGYYILDQAAVPEHFEPPKIPAAAKQCWERTYRRYQTPFDMQALLDYVEGKDLAAKNIDPVQIWQVRKWREQEPVTVRLCRTPGCREQIVITCRVAANAIRGNKLLGDLEKNIPPRPYEPSTLCEEHYFGRDERRKEKRGESLIGAQRVCTPRTPQIPKPSFPPKLKEVVPDYGELRRLTRQQVEDLQAEGLEPPLEILTSLREMERLAAAESRFVPSPEEVLGEASEEELY